VAQLYDAFTINVLLFLEDLGFCERGESGDFVMSGAIAPGGSLPVNTTAGTMNRTARSGNVCGAAELMALGPTGRLVNVGRDLVDTETLIVVLEKGGLFGAGLDVLEGEPAVPKRLAELPNVVLTPHIGGATKRGLPALADLRAQLRHLLQGI
jgi:hypothetical protein